jgi:hypothetical protein
VYVCVCMHAHVCIFMCKFVHVGECGRERQGSKTIQVLDEQSVFCSLRYRDVIYTYLFITLTGGPDLQGGRRGWGNYLHLWSGTQ